jgi:hypothetical protein
LEEWAASSSSPESLGISRQAENRHAETHRVASRPSICEETDAGSGRIEDTAVYGMIGHRMKGNSGEECAFLGEGCQGFEELRTCAEGVWKNLTRKDRIWSEEFTTPMSKLSVNIKLGRAILLLNTLPRTMNA